MLPFRYVLLQRSQSQQELTHVTAAILGLLALGSYVAVNAVFSLCAIALDGSYIIPSAFSLSPRLHQVSPPNAARSTVACKLWFRDHPEVNYVPGPFDLGRGWLEKFINYTAVLWSVSSLSSSFAR